jgi:hypothetical protein
MSDVQIWISVFATCVGSATIIALILWSVGRR